MGLTGKVALVTGAGSGIGRETAIALAEQGADIAINDLYLDRAEETARLVSGLGRKALAIQADISRQEDVQRMADRAMSALSKIDILVNNAGIFTIVPFTEITFQEWSRMFAVHSDGAFHCTQRVVPGMMERKWGRIINLSSLSAINGAFPGTVHYSAAKGALLGFTKSLARELARYNITANAIAPGFIETPMSAIMTASPRIRENLLQATPLRRLGKPRDIASAIVFLASEEAGFITGQVLSPSGGLYI